MTDKESSMTDHEVVSREKWVEARRQFLAKEKEFTRLRDELSRQRRELPWERVDKRYVFAGPTGKVTLSDLFAGKSQLVVYHFMFAPDSDAGCRGCSFWADNYDGTIAHLEQRDVSFVAISRAPMNKLQAFAGRMGWSFKWVSGADTDFNYDYQASFREEDLARESAVYNYERMRDRMSDKPGFSVFYKDESGNIYHTYSTYARGIDPMNVTFQLLDLVPKGRDEAGLPHPMSWVRLRDQYE
jgi:predicted dithiol-disulfide oxidoreductase (DUF899 family)